MYRDNMESFLLQKCEDEGIRVTFVEDYSFNTPSLSYPKLKRIFINTANDDSCFELAHEMSHMVHTESDLLYTATFTAKQKIEAEANAYAIELMASYHFQDAEAEHADVDAFMKCYKIPSFLRDQCFDVVKNMYMKEFSLN